MSRVHVNALNIAPVFFKTVTFASLSHTQTHSLADIVSSETSFSDFWKKNRQIFFKKSPNENIILK